MTEQERPGLSDLAAEAYVYGFPLVFNLEQVQRFTRDGMGSLAPAPFNTFAHARTLAGPQDTFVTINNDTLYSMAHLDLADGPLLLRVPDTAGRYYVLQFVDAWTNNFAYVGHRATGTAAGTFLITPPGRRGEAPEGVRVIESPTRVCSIIGRWACDGPQDLRAVAALQDALTLEPRGQAAPGLPAPDARVTDGPLFFEKLRLWLAAFPPASPEYEYQQRFARLGLLDAGPSPYAGVAGALADALHEGLTAGRARVEDCTTHGPSPSQNGWKLTYHAFDYNQDFLGPGTDTDPRWVIADRAQARLSRAAAARAGLWGNHGYEAAYAMTWIDRDGETLDGARPYTLRFTAPPPVDAFWSITMYDLPEYYLVANPIDRYSIGDRTPGLHYAADGSLTLHLRPDAPNSPEARANWLPTPPGPFRPVLRMYEPHQTVFDGGYTLPPIEPAD
ncbi:DUF1254 domain-containing protein [Streptomyces mangrovisoli]|uniref:ATP synthase subunit alpha n=1 Tax=Streptomyces mangrovisoli TaxID=1428628 RepID=A0A1J4NX21_9ACTN|nr:DUF1254 domain-containing protein [Streptomyces mangrovisoli]OIJ66044.1 hypothetical protein WN71_020480 [Streptomyces mangrovisoli]